MFQLAARVDMKGIEDLIRRFPEASRKAREARITEALLFLERAVAGHTPEGAGPVHIRETYHSKVRMTGERVWGTMGTPVKYGEPLELGSKPHFPPLGPLRYWVERKLGYTGREAASVAFLIARAISRRGTKPARMFGRALDENEARVIRILEHIPADIIRSINK